MNFKFKRKKKKKNKGKRPWLLNSVGAGNGYIDWDTAIFHVVLLKFAVHEGRISGNLCFANDILPGLDTQPQIIKRSLPPITNELINVIKASALLSVISVNELTKIMNDIIFEYFVVIEVLIEATVMYLIIISILVFISRYFEKKLII